MAYKQTSARGKSNSYSSFQQKGFISPLKQANPDLAIQAAHRTYLRDPANTPQVVNTPGGLTITTTPSGGKTVVKQFENPDGSKGEQAVNWSDLTKEDRRNYGREVTNIQNRGFAKTPAYQEYSRNTNQTGKYYNPNTSGFVYRNRWQNPQN